MAERECSIKLDDQGELQGKLLHMQSQRYMHTYTHTNSNASMQSGMAIMHINDSVHTHTHAAQTTWSVCSSMHCIGFHFLYVLGLQMLIMSR